jgi:plasmid stabilization system protein ParE
VRYRLLLTDKALADIDRVLDWFQKQKATTAGQRWFTALWKTLDRLESHPERCSPAVEAEEVGRDVRERRFGKRRGVYRVLFELRDNTVYILRIWHSARDAFTADDL